MARPSSPNLKVLDFELGLSQNLPNICRGQTLSSEPLKDSKLMMFLLEDSSGKGELHLRFFLGVQFSWFMPSGNKLSKTSLSDIFLHREINCPKRPFRTYFLEQGRGVQGPLHEVCNGRELDAEVREQRR